MNRQCLNQSVRVVALGATLVTGTLGLLGLTGCQSNNPDTVHLDPSPELFTRSKSYDQNQANWQLTLDRDARGLVDDFQRAFLLDRASRLNKSPNPW